MNDKKEDILPPVRVDLGARAEAKFELKGEIPSASLGRAVDALVDIIRPFSEARGLRADLLRLQREEVAIEIARRGIERIKLEQGTIRPIPTKLLVPLMELGSCESPDDSEMIRRWSELLASAAMGNEVPPRFVGVLGELSGRQATALETVAFSFVDQVEVPDVSFIDASPNFEPNWVNSEIADLVQKTLTSRRKIDATFDKLVARFTAPGCYLETITMWVNPGDEFYSWDGHERPNINPSDLNILESLGLVQKCRLDTIARFSSKKGALKYRFSTTV
jgi:hypothetical protein